MILNEVRQILEKSWSKETCSLGLKDNWTKDNKALGQCAVTALVVNDFLGGKIMRCMCESGSHYYNLINGEVVDLTDSQFKEIPDYSLGEERTREYLLSNIDILVDGPFVLEERSLELKFRGSRNQRIIDVQESIAKGKAVIVEI